MKRYVIMLAFLLGTSVLAGCVKSTIEFSEDQSATMTFEGRQHYFIGGLVPNETVFKDSHYCPLGKEISKFEALFTASDVLLTIVSLNLYAPKTVRIWCHL